jgi:branched-subunit amino acid permease
MPDFTWVADGATVIPVILNTNKTQLCILTGGKTTYSVYMTIGNFYKTIWHKLSYHAQTLIGYLPTFALGNIELNKTFAWLGCFQLFHKAMDIIFFPLNNMALNSSVWMVPFVMATHFWLVIWQTTQSNPWQRVPITMWHVQSMISPLINWATGN